MAKKERVIEVGENQLLELQELLRNASHPVVAYRCQELGYETPELKMANEAVRYMERNASKALSIVNSILWKLSNGEGGCA